MKDITKRAGVVWAAVVGLFLAGFVAASGASATTDPPPDPVSQGFTDAGTKVALYGGAMVALVLVGLLIMLGIKYLRRGVSKA
jgi:hypothetical protein